jgi:AcrR family transcriptional regulator
MDHSSAPTAKRARRSAISTRSQILATATRLFRTEGIRIVGIDRIIAESGVAKMTLYRQFPSKEALILAYLAHCREVFWRRAEQAVARATSEPRARIIAFMDAVLSLIHI